MKRGAPRRSGFSLIELLVVIVIISLGLVSISTMFVGAIISDMKAERISYANDRAIKEMERLRGATFSNAVVDTTVFRPADGYTILSQGANGSGVVAFAVPELPQATGRVAITYYNPGTGIYPNLKQIAVSLSWLGGKSARGSVVLTTFIGNRP